MAHLLQAWAPCKPQKREGGQLARQPKSLMPHALCDRSISPLFPLRATPSQVMAANEAKELERRSFLEEGRRLREAAKGEKAKLEQVRRGCSCRMDCMGCSCHMQGEGQQQHVAIKVASSAELSH